MLQILATLTGSVLAGLGWMIQRGMRGDAVDEAITRRLKLVELYQRMKAVGLDAKALERLESDLARPTRTANPTESRTNPAISASDPSVRPS